MTRGVAQSPLLKPLACGSAAHRLPSSRSRARDTTGSFSGWTVRSAGGSHRGVDPWPPLPRISRQTLFVFIENGAGSAHKHVFDEKRRVLQSIQPVSRPYPYAYGFVLDTSAADGDHLDCFVLTERPLASGEVVECSLLGLMEQLEDGLVDHNLLAVPVGESAEVSAAVQTALREFVTHVFDHIPGRVVQAGRFLGVDAAGRHLATCRG